MALAVADSLYLITNVIYICEFSVNISGYYIFTYYTRRVMAEIHTTTEVVTRAWSMWFTVVITISRFIAVVYPFHAKRYITLQRMIITIVVIMIAAILFIVPDIIHATGTLCYLNASCDFNETTLVYVENEFSNFHVIYALSTEILIVVIPFILLVIFGSALIRSYLKTRRAVEDMSETRCGSPASAAAAQDARQITLVTIAIVVVWVVCQVPWIIYEVDLLGDLNMINGYMGWDLDQALHVVNTLKMINSAVNFVIYCQCRRNFRQQLRALCCARDSSKDSPGAQTTEITL